MGKKTSRPKTAEWQDTIAVADYLRLRDLLFMHIPNEGKRTPEQGAILKRMGLSKGAPDFIVFEPRGGFHGFALELKTEDGRLTKEQLEWAANLSRRGYAWTMAKGVDEAIRKIDFYLGLEEAHA